MYIRDDTDSTNGTADVVTVRTPQLDQRVSRKPSQKAMGKMPAVELMLLRRSCPSG